jgi:hypothetical protein
MNHSAAPKNTGASSIKSGALLSSVSVKGGNQKTALFHVFIVDKFLALFEITFF